MILNIDLVSDFVCPWCFLGKFRLDRAIEELRAARPDLDIRVNWLPFFLNPDTPEAGEPYRAFLEAKFGGPIKADAVLDKVRDAAAEDGLNYAFERIRTRPNTLQAHRLMYRAQSIGQTPAHIQMLADALFTAHFQEGRDIGDKDTLADIAAACGERRDAVREWLDGREDIDKVRRMAEGVRSQGIEGVPFFILNRKLAVSGAQSAAVLGAAILQSLENGKPS
ncbi:DsbA family oxidoreductase [Thauera linaloolentis]|uniref:DSBA oxidoreductase n=1 Tax=Thauera linaloolentis (strain DSM 12138 / JCM 21573 / CCUG 41526 / CIP 105981 / IAM 15112 / NBRC 102519 / 47Lol) TaxID=1123367 RepID=N6YZT2_THAL4|nr:DsbA family oxidoreductase [Thauera linaloolentis]ENO85389.1 DSBA oxidoreductase [Thauera linaloolentis 47Lol = DSM 12138]MCM8564653.1 DsbA family oxidoreductase [Thauera linaloolentis]